MQSRRRGRFAVAVLSKWWQEAISFLRYCVAQRWCWHIEFLFVSPPVPQYRPHEYFLEYTREYICEYSENTREDFRR